ncbi:MAG: RNA-binding protein [Verrucomicrobia bacterium]|nr:MAG: RNA-binding protein [Verrucomicrobiota bacterium]
MNPERTPLHRRLAAAFAAIVLICLTYSLARFPSLSSDERAKLAAHFKFDKLPLAEVQDHPAYKYVRNVHPSLKRISAWVSTLGAAATLADLDGDGLPNDLCSIDPRTDLVTVAPVPGTGRRYAPFTLNPKPLPFDPANTAPMGVIAGDFNEDGLMDLMVYYWGRTPVLFLRKKVDIEPGHQKTLTADDFYPCELTDSGERWFSNGAVQADLDGDGHVDILIGNYFQDGGHILDANAGGVEVMHEGKAKALNGGKKHLFLWAGATEGEKPSVKFTEVKDVFSPDVEHGWTLAIGAADLDGDMLPEIYFGHDFGPDRLLHNLSTPGRVKFAVLEGRRRFTDPKSCVLGFDSFKGMGVDFGDVNGDGLLDIYVSNIATRFGLTESHFLWQSTGQLDLMKQGVAPYVQASEKLGLSRSGWGWDCRLADFDNDGVLEAIQAVGFIKGKINRWPELQSLGTSNDRIVHDPRLWPNFKPGPDPSQQDGADLSGHDLDAFFVRAADGRYYDVGQEVGFTEPMVTKAIALADVDGDGRLDFVMANQWGPSFFFHNQTRDAGAFLGLHLLLPLPAEASQNDVRHRAGHPGPDLHGRPAFGAQAHLTLPGGRRLVGQVDGGSGHSGRRSPDVHLGLGHLGPATQLDVQIKWRGINGKVQQTTLKLSPGWHTVLLGSPGQTQVAQTN